MLNLNKKTRPYIWTVLIIFMAYILWRAIFVGEEDRVRKFIREGEKAVQAKNIFTCASMISPQYQDKYGNDRSSLIYIAKEVFTYYKNIFIDVQNLKIKLDKTRKEAEVEIEVLVICQTQENKSEKIFEAELGRVRVKLIKEEKKWKLWETEFLEELTIMGQKVV